MDQDDNWIKLVHAFNNNDKNFSEYIIELKNYKTQWLEYLREKLFSNERVVAFSILKTLTETELLRLFDVLVYYASFTHGSTKYFRELIIGLPREWVTKNIEDYTHSLLENGSEDQYRRVLELYLCLDPALASKLAKQATLNNDPGIKEVGNDFMAILAEQNHE